LDEVDRLPLEEQDLLRDILSKRIVERRRSQIANEISEARAEYRAGGCRPVSADDLMQEIAPWSGCWSGHQHLFVRSAKRILKKFPQAAEDIRHALIQLENDAFHPTLRIHKLKGKLRGSWACCAGYDLRIIFRFGRHSGEEAVFLETIGTHDEVYWSSEKEGLIRIVKTMKISCKILYILSKKRKPRSGRCDSIVKGGGWNP
jgi:mRNA-degrading endonuclease YafQ of YafQ-DinJ toxin-antitoxin module